MKRLYHIYDAQELFDEITLQAKQQAQEEMEMTEQEYEYLSQDVFKKRLSMPNVTDTLGDFLRKQLDILETRRRIRAEIAEEIMKEEEKL